ELRFGDNDGLAQLVAIKIMPKAEMVRKNQVQHILAERDIMARADNPFVVKMYYAFQSPRHLYLVMEFVNGGDLYSMLQALQCLNESVARTYAAEIVLALEYLHEVLRVTHRDIKPDNLLVAGDPDRYPNFLSSPEAFSIGLIDVETAVDFLPADGKLRQPQLGGTPFYATPHHMFGNKTLAEVYPDLPRVFYLQDWFATVAMIYGIIIGEYLFGQTAKQLAALTRNIQKAFQAKQPPAQILKQANLTFWRSADNEFAANMKKNEDALRGIQTILLEPVQNMLIAELDKENTRKEKQIKALVARQQIFKNQKNREQLLLGSADKIAQIIVTLKKKRTGGRKRLGPAGKHPGAQSLDQAEPGKHLLDSAGPGIVHIQPAGNHDGHDPRLPGLTTPHRRAADQGGPFSGSPVYDIILQQSTYFVYFITTCNDQWQKKRNRKNIGVLNRGPFVRPARPTAC
ncbi:MAG: protein kinase domain-containing protein, partial [Desulfosudaceae bacterium]